MTHTTPRSRALAIGLAAIIGLSLGACSSSDASTTPTSGMTSTAGPDAPNLAGGGDFCDNAIASLAAANDIQSSTDDLGNAFSDPSALASGDMTKIHEYSQAILDSSTATRAFYEAGASSATDPAAKEAFDGLLSFVDQYALPVAQAGLDADSMMAYATTVSALVQDPEVQSLLQKVSGWATTAATYTQEQCGISSDSSS